jgi:RNA polymerase-binding transcription factor DksA
LSAKGLKTVDLAQPGRGDAMKKVELKPYKEMLLKLRARLRGDVSAMADAALNKTRSESSGDLSSMPIHMADVGTDNFEQEFTLSLMENEETVLEQIETALERIEDGSYGVCLDCEGKILKARLNAIPHTPFCVKCASKLEAR